MKHIGTASTQKSLHTYSLCLHQWRVPKFALKYPCNPPPPPGARRLATRPPPPHPEDRRALTREFARGGKGTSNGGGGGRALRLLCSMPPAGLTQRSSPPTSSPPRCAVKALAQSPREWASHPSGAVPCIPSPGGRHTDQEEKPHALLPEGRPRCEPQSWASFQRCTSRTSPMAAS